MAISIHDRGFRTDSNDVLCRHSVIPLSSWDLIYFHRYYWTALAKCIHLDKTVRYFLVRFVSLIYHTWSISKDIWLKMERDQLMIYLDLAVKLKIDVNPFFPAVNWRVWVTNVLSAITSYMLPASSLKDLSPPKIYGLSVNFDE